jgi:hypothetical protein
MPRQTAGNKLEAAIKAKAALDAEIKALQMQERDRKRHEDERRFTVLGRTVLAFVTDAPADPLSHAITALLDRSITRASERALFPFLAQAVSAAKPPLDQTVHVPATPEASAA